MASVTNAFGRSLQFTYGATGTLVHQIEAGSREAVRQLTAYLEERPDDLRVRWLLNLACMTLGEHPQKVEPKFLVNLDKLMKSEFDIGRFREETMAFPPSVTVKDYTWGGSAGYLNPKRGAQPQRFPTTTSS